MRQVDTSLRRLGVEHLDMYLIHEPDPTTPLDETLRALDDMVRQGKLRYLGASNMPAWLMTKALWISDKYCLHRFEWVQNSYSLLDRADERELFPLCQDQALGYTPFSPLAGGWLTGKYRAGQPFPAGSRMTLRPEPYQRLLSDQVFRGLDALQSAAAVRGADLIVTATTALIRLFVTMLPTRMVGSRLVLGLDTSSILRPDAHTSVDRTLVYRANLPADATPVEPGWFFSTLVVLPEPVSRWTSILDTRRVPSSACRPRCVS